MAVTKPTITVVSSTDNNYAMPLAVALRSAAENLSPSHQLHAFILESGVSDENRRRLEASVVAFGVAVTWRPVQLPTGRFTLGSHPGGVAATYFRLFMGEQLPKETKMVIYLDADVIVCKDLVQLWETPLEGMMLAAVADSLWQSERMRRMKVLDGEAGHYFNAGVMLIDLTAWRGANVIELASYFADLYREHLYIAEQDLLNCVIGGKFKPLEPAWNLLEFYGIAYRKYWGKLAPYGTAALNAANQTPAIVHYSGFPKPWEGPYAAHDPALFRRYYASTCWRELPLPDPDRLPPGKNYLYRKTLAIMKVFYRELELGRVDLKVVRDLAVHLLKNWSAFTLLPDILSRNGYWAVRAYLIPKRLARRQRQR